MPTITLQFSRPDPAHQNPLDRAVSAGIRHMTRSEISHVDVVTDEGTLIGAHIKEGVRERTADYQKWGLRIRVTVPCTPAQREKFFAYVRSRIGTPYDTRDILGIALGDARLHDTAHLICSGLGALAVDAASGIVRVAKDWWQVSPEELRIAMMATAGATEERIEGNGSATAPGTP